VPYDSKATRKRLVEAAVREFSAYGLAGARVDRIAVDARANKRAIYDYFTNKEGLFDAAVNRVVQALNDAVPLTENDLPGYVAELFDYLHAHPEAVRMLSWQRLERPAVGPRLTDAFIAHLAAVPGAGPIAPVDLVILTIGLANAWYLTGPDLADGDPTDPARIASHRAAVIEAARRLTAA
jgi:AcrR family transcriptional regulator